MALGKTIKIFLIDGDPNGRLSCELSSWTGKAYKIPKTKIRDCFDRDDLLGTGVYFLFGKNEEGVDQVYVGEAESVFIRLKEQLTKIDFWNEAIVLISKDENLNKAHIKYLENRFYELAKSAKRCKIENAVIPTKSSISEPDRAEMAEFLQNARLLISTLGHKVFEEKRESSQGVKLEKYFLKGPRGANANGQLTSEGFLVFNGSRMALETSSSMPSGFIKRRDTLLQNGQLRLMEDSMEFTDDIIFSSPSTAASIVLGRNANGLTEWKDASGKNLKEQGDEKPSMP